MITWIQRNLQNKVFFLILLAIIIVAFVFTIGAAPGIGSAQSKAMRRDFFGLNLASQEDQERLFRDASLSIELQFGFPALDGDRFQQYALERHAGIFLANELRIPAPTDAAVAAHVRSLRAFANEQGRFDARRYADFQDGLRTNPRLTEADVSRVIIDDIRYLQVRELLAGPGFVLPAEVADQLILTDSVWTLGIARLDPASVQPDLTLTDEQIEAFFARNDFRYELAPQVGVDFVKLRTEDYLDKVTLTAQDIRAHFDANPARFPKPETAGFSLLNEDADHFEAVRAEVELALRRQRAGRLVSQAAADLALAIFEENVTRANLQSFLAGRGLELQAASPFDRAGTPPELAGARQVGTEAFRLTAERPFSDPVQTADGVALLVWRESIPARIPELAEVRAEVADDLAAELKREAFVTAGSALRAAVQNKLSSGAEFAVAVAEAAEAAGLTVDVDTPEPFSFNPPPRDLDFSIFNVLMGLEVGQLGQFVVGSQGRGLIVYAKDKQTPPATPDNPRFAETRLQLAAATANRAGSDYLRALIEKELMRSEQGARR